MLLKNVKIKFTGSVISSILLCAMAADKPSAGVEHRRRLQALGQVTAAVAHEGNNVLLSMQLTGKRATTGKLSATPK